MYLLNFNKFLIFHYNLEKYNDSNLLTDNLGGDYSRQNPFFTHKEFLHLRFTTHSSNEDWILFIY